MLLLPRLPSFRPLCVQDAISLHLVWLCTFRFPVYPCLKREKACDYGCAHLKHDRELEIAVDALFSLVADLFKCVGCGL